MLVAFDPTTSILQTVKKTLGLDPDYDAFDADILVSAGTAILALKQIGVGDSNFSLTDAKQTWNDFIPECKDGLAVAQYISQRVRLVFDPPSSSYVVDAINKNLDELLWRLNVEYDQLAE